MPASGQLQHLVRLFDDRSPTVRQAVLRALREFGAELGEELDQLQPALDPVTRRRLLNFAELAPVNSQESLGLAETTGTDGPPVREALFDVGQLMHHKSYGYRGVIVNRDMTCQADKAWYQANRTRPRRDQPWYHVLLDGSDQITYVAQTNVEVDSSDEVVEHPLVDHFFTDFQNGRYLRNGRPWPRA